MTVRKIRQNATNAFNSGARVSVRLLDGTLIYGLVNAISPWSFSLTGRNLPIRYDDAEAVEIVKEPLAA